MDFIAVYRMRIGLHYGRHNKIKGLDYLTPFESLIILSLLLLKSGDIETNPGPDTDSLSSSSSTPTQFEELMIKNKFSVVHCNVQSLASKIEAIEPELSNFDVICLTETWLDHRTSDDLLALAEYTLYRRDRGRDAYGGICVYVKNELYSRRRNDLEVADVECVWLEIHNHNRKVLIGTFYRPPNSTHATLNSIENSIGLAFDTDTENILITGDFNFDMLKQFSNRKINDICLQFNLEQLINEPTHYTESSSSIIDLFLTSKKDTILLSGVGEPFLEQNIRYHCPIYCVFNFNKTVTASYERHIWLYDRGDYEALSNDIRQTNWDEIKSNDIDKYAQDLTNQLTKLAKKHIPNKLITTRQTDPPWLCNNIKKLMRKRKRLYDKYKRTNSIHDLESYKQTRNKVTAAIRKAKAHETEKLTQKLRFDNINSKNWWKTLKNFIKPGQTSSIPPLCKDDVIYSDPNDKANIFNNFFTEQTTLDDSNASLPPTFLIPASTFSSVSTTPLEVESIFKSLKTGKAAGPDCINNRLLREVATALSFPVCDLFNFSLTQGKVPSLWKLANVTPIHKKNDPSDFANYRPISLLSTIGKSLEKIIHKHVFNFFRANSVLTNVQSGFIPADSTVNQLVDIYNTFCKALDEGKEVRAIFCDVSKAFDRVWHKGLLFKLKSVGISDSLLDWFEDYLSNRKQRVVLPGATSRWTNIKAGVPQGSILGPLLFLVYINDIVDEINSNIRLFADDTSLYIIVENPIEAAIQLNADLEKVHQWASKWLVTFNPTKTESLLFTRKHNRPYHPPVTMNNNVITEVTDHKHLGLTFSSDCTWHEHLDSVKIKAWSRINIMRKLKFTLDRMSLQIIYFSFIRPLLEYADVVWDNCTQYEASELEKIQNEAARIVTGATKLVSINSLSRETGWESLAQRRKKHKLELFYKMQNDLSHDYLSVLVPPTVGSTSTYQLRNAPNVQLIHANTQLYYNSFLPSAAREWNGLSQDVRDINSLGAFKRKLNADNTKPPSYFNSGSRLGQIYHTRLRTHCSSLNEHLFTKNIVDSPLCVCGEVENTHHYLFDCTRYEDLRRELLNAVSYYCEPTVNSILFGNSALTSTQNQNIFIAVQDYLIKSKRFKVN